MIETRRSPLDPTQHEMLDRVEADRAAVDRVGDGGRHVLDLECLHEAQHLDKLALALLAHAGLEETPQCRELLRQLPADERRGLVQCVDLPLDQREVMQRVEYEVLPLVRARMTRDDLSAAGDDDLVHIAAHKHLAMTVGCRHGIVVAAGNAPMTTKRPSWRSSRRRHRLAAEALERSKIARPAVRRSSGHDRASDRSCGGGNIPARCALSASKLSKTGIGTRKLRRAKPTSPSTLPLSLPLPGRPKRSSNR